MNEVLLAEHEAHGVDGWAVGGNQLHLLLGVEVITFFS